MPDCVGGWPSRQEQAAATQQLHRCIEQHGWDALRQCLEQAHLFPATHAPSSAGQVPATDPPSSAGQFPATDLPAHLPSSAAGHAGSALPGLPCSLNPSSAAASPVPATKAQSSAASEGEVLQTSQLSQLHVARSAMPALPIAPRPQLQLQAQYRSSLAPAQLRPQALSCPSLPPEMTQQPTGTTAVALIHPEQPVGTTAVAVIHPEQPVGPTAVAVIHPDQQHAVSQSVAGSLVAALQAPNLAQVCPSPAFIRISTVEPLSHSHSSLSGNQHYILCCCSGTHSCGATSFIGPKADQSCSQRACSTAIGPGQFEAWLRSKRPPDVCKTGGVGAAPLRSGCIEACLKACGKSPGSFAAQQLPHSRSTV